jgi:hypothetical protein
MYLAIDNRRVIRQPHIIEIVPAGHEQGYTADQRPWVRPAGEYSVFNCTWGADYSYQDVLSELDRLRGNRGVHAVTFELRRDKYWTCNAYMGKPQYTMMGKTTSGKIATNSFSIPFIQVDTPTFLFPMRFRLPGIISVRDAFASRPAPMAGRIFAIDGWIRDTGSGVGQTRIQVANDTAAIDYLAAPSNHVLTNAVLGASLDFAQDDLISIDVDAVPSGGLSKDALITLWCWGFRP